MSMEEFRVIDEKYIRDMSPLRPDSGHKGTFGNCLIVAGSKYMTGALVLAADSALRSGTGIVRVFSEDEALLPLKIACPCAVTSAYKDTLTKTLKELNKLISISSATGIGSGIDINNSYNEALLEMAITSSSSLVIDASALQIISSNEEHFFALLRNRVAEGKAPAILTPHIGEFSRLLGTDLHGKSEDELKVLASDFAETTGVVLVLKSSTVYISERGNNNRLYAGNNSGMAKGGSGDVLMGLIAGLMSQGLNAFDAACAATYFHQRAGVKASSDIGKRAMLPSDLTKYYGLVFDESGW